MREAKTRFSALVFVCDLIVAGGAVFGAIGAMADDRGRAAGKCLLCALVLAIHALAIWWTSEERGPR